MRQTDLSAGEIFLAVVGKTADEERAAYLDDACAGNTELRARVERLLRARPNAEHFLESPAPELGITTNWPVTERPGSVVGPYKLLEQIGEGGFGIVFMAEQTTPVRRKVALKVIKPGMDTRQVIARFEAERQALALMDHPNIAKVLDAGTTDESSRQTLGAVASDGTRDVPATTFGRPYFVMELVAGIPITNYCDQCSLSTVARLDLFVCVCRAVQHAHQKGVIHRDLKPSNVLVAMQDGQPTPKIIDFGVAKAINQRLTDQTLMSGFTQMLGTPLYMSPEQAEMSPLAVDTRSDIYSLGVLLYELLTGTTPFERSQFSEASYDEVRRIIREQEPPTPSARLSTLGQEAETVAKRRRTDARKLWQAVRGDLDWIVMKCLEKDRTRRYATANDLARDVERYLHDEPVEVSPPSRTYQLRKFVRRNRGPVIAAMLIAVSLLAGIGVSTWQMVRARFAEQSALKSAQLAQQAAQAERTAKERESAQRRQAKAVSDFLVSAFRRPDPGVDGREITMAQVLARSAKELQDAYQGDPGTKAALLAAIGESYMGLGLYSDAIPLLEQARPLYEQAKSSEISDVISAMTNLGFAYYRAGRIDQSKAILDEAIKVSRARLGPNHLSTLSVISTASALEHDAEGADERIALLEDTLKKLKSQFGIGQHSTLVTMNNLANAYGDAGRFKEQLALFEELLKLQKERLGPDHPHVLIVMSNMAVTYGNTMQWDQAMPLLEEIVKRRTATLGPRHPDTLWAMNHLAWAYENMERNVDAIPLLEKAVAASQNVLGKDHFETLDMKIGLVTNYLEAGRVEDAIPLGEETLKLQTARFGRNHPNTQRAINNLFRAYVLVGKLGKDVSVEETLRILNAMTAPTNGNHPVDAVVLYLRSGFLARLGYWREASADLLQLIALEPENHVNYHALAPLLVASGDLEAYRRHCAKMVELFGNTADPNIAERVSKDCLILPSSGTDAGSLETIVNAATAGGENHWGWPYFQFVKGLYEFRQGRVASSAKWIEGVLARPGEVPFRDAQAHLVLAMARHRLEQFEPARSALAKGEAIINASSTTAPGVLNENWSDWLIARALLSEAKSLISAHENARPEPQRSQDRRAE
jgi:serine/threonine protein kinase/tetratricopeptide (TPR) repeat protein